MFVRTRVRGNETTQVQIVENHRQGKKVVQKLVRSVSHAVNQNGLDQFIAIAATAIVELKNRKASVLAFQDPFEIYAPKKRGADKEICEN